MRKAGVTATVGLMVLGIAAGGARAEAAAAALETTEPTLVEALTTGTPAVDVRLRYEHVEQDGLKDGDAVTVRPRLGYGTQPFKSFQVYVEFEDVEALNDGDDYSQAGTNPGGKGRATIADVEGAEVNQAYLSGECPLTGSQVKIGRQRIVLDNARFVGNVGWRQNEQTFDAARIVWKHADLLEADYSYVVGVNRIFGEDHGTSPDGAAPNAADLESDSHFIHLSTPALKVVTVTGYAYLLDLGEANNFGATNSSDTVGLRLTGKYDVREGYALKYEGEYAVQSDNDATADALNYEADYYRVKLDGVTPWGSVGVGREVLGSDDGVAFQTPLATLHAFNGWADVFLTTPGTGLEETFLTVGTVLPGSVDLQAIYSDFQAESGSVDYGSEIGVQAKRKLGKNLTLLAKYANYDASDDAGNPRAADVEKAIIEATFAF